MKVEIGLILDSRGKRVGKLLLITGDDCPSKDVGSDGLDAKARVRKVLADIAGKPDAIKTAGYNAACNHPGCPIGTALWDHVLWHGSQCRYTEPDTFVALNSPAENAGRPLPQAGN